MKDFEVKLSLRKYLELGGQLTTGQTLLCIEHYPCKLLSKRKKIFKGRDGVAHPKKLMHYKVEFLNDGLYPKGTIYECLLSELDVLVMVRNVEDIPMEEITDPSY